jgi:hypothetical protein
MRRVLQLAALGAVLTFAAKADVVEMIFDGLVSPTTGVALLADGDEVQNYFDGGEDSYGNTGPNYGVTFSDDATTYSNAEAGNGTGTAPFGGDPFGDTALTFVSGGSATMDVAGSGFSNGFSFYYSADGQSTISIWDGPGGSGDLLQTLTLTVNTSACTPSETFCPFTPLGVSFSGVAESVTFGNTVGLVAFDDFTLGSDIPATSEPGALKMLGLGLVCLLAVSRKRRKLQQDTGRRFES